MGNDKIWTPLHMDSLKELGNIGAGHAATSLSKLLKRKIDMHVPGVHIVSFDDMMELAGGAEIEMVCVCLRIDGEAPGNMFFLIPPAQVERLVFSMTGYFPHLLDAFMKDSVIQELGNILTGAYVPTLSDFMNINLFPSVPSIAKDMIGAILSTGLIQSSQVSDCAIVMETSFVDGEQSETIEGKMFLFPDPDSLARLLLQ